MKKKEVVFEKDLLQALHDFSRKVAHDSTSLYSLVSEYRTFEKEKSFAYQRKDYPKQLKYLTNVLHDIDSCSGDLLFEEKVDEYKKINSSNKRFIWYAQNVLSQIDGILIPLSSDVWAAKNYTSLSHSFSECRVWYRNGWHKVTIPSNAGDVLCSASDCYALRRKRDPIFWIGPYTFSRKYFKVYELKVTPDSIDFADQLGYGVDGYSECRMEVLRERISSCDHVYYFNSACKHMDSKIRSSPFHITGKLPDFIQYLKMFSDNSKKPYSCNTVDLFHALCAFGSPDVHCLRRFIMLLGYSSCFSGRWVIGKYIFIPNVVCMRVFDDNYKCGCYCSYKGGGTSSVFHDVYRVGYVLDPTYGLKVLAYFEA